MELNPETRTIRYTPEYFAVKHFSNLIEQGAEIVGFQPRDGGDTTILVAKNLDGKYVAVAGNFSASPKPMTVQINKKYLNATLPPHSFNSFLIK